MNFIKAVALSLLQKDRLSKVWFKQDDQFLLPKANVVMELFCPLSYISPQHCNQVYMFTG